MLFHFIQPDLNTWEVGRTFKQLGNHSTACDGFPTLLQCSPNFLCAQIRLYKMEKHFIILKLIIILCRIAQRRDTAVTKEVGQELDSNKKLFKKKFREFWTYSVWLLSFCSFSVTRKWYLGIEWRQDLQFTSAKLVSNAVPYLTKSWVVLIQVFFFFLCRTAY